MNVKNFFLGVAIFILTIAVGIYGVRTLHGPGPKYEDSCPNRQVFTDAQCIEIGGEWINSTNPYEPQSAPMKAVPVSTGYCDTYTKCQKVYDGLRSVYAKKVFVTALPLAILLIIIGALVFGLESVGAGVIAGGVGNLIYGVAGFWEFAGEGIKFAISLIGLVIVIFLTYYINQRLKFFEKKKK